MRITSGLLLACITLLPGCSDEMLPVESDPSAIVGPSAAITVKFPAEDPGPPYYAVLERLFIPHTDAWAAIVFVRDPACISAGFNLLNQIAVPAAFGCPAKVEGHATFKNAPPPIDPVPAHVLMHGTGAVPVWFVPWSVLEATLADDMLTIPELLALPSLVKGTATVFQFTQHPGLLRPQGFGNGKIEMVARGALEDGRPFFLQLREMGVEGESVLRHVAIELE
jgi:hypothetical protein